MDFKKLVIELKLDYLRGYSYYQIIMGILTLLIFLHEYMGFINQVLPGVGITWVLVGMILISNVGCFAIGRFDRSRWGIWKAEYNYNNFTLADKNQEMYDMIKEIYRRDNNER